MLSLLGRRRRAPACVSARGDADPQGKGETRALLVCPMAPAAPSRCTTHRSEEVDIGLPATRGPHYEDCFNAPVRPPGRASRRLLQAGQVFPERCHIVRCRCMSDGCTT
ncbi:unnamed protein product [Prorocentrum cordatum]|uniref:Uncharacterized protein n=1 Tax=Prorocentrum cordatum TaxID=2364126 RepID=A0ABN9QHG4_9DINO|nr:unnamed protein product [Polarella glacialis]